MLKINEFLAQATTQGYKSNVLRPLVYICVIGFIVTIVMFRFEIPEFGRIMGYFSILSFILLLIAYFYCLVTNPDLLRSEKYNIERSLINKVNVVGDSTMAKLNLPDSNYIFVEGKNNTNQEDEKEV